jgi:AcrR family transcriptional regulator
MMATAPPVRTQRAPARSAGEDTQNRILDEAQALFSERGYVGTTVQQVAARIGITKAALYYHFPQGKEEIFVELMRRHLRRLHDGLEQIVSQGGATRERLEAIAVYMAARAPAGDIDKLRRELIHIDESHRAALRDEFHRRIVGTIYVLLRRGVELGELREHNSELATWMFLHSVCSLSTDCPNACALPADAPQALVALLLDGIAA